MRESNFAFPAQNKACVCITSQLYDRRALDTTSPLPLFNSLTHLTYLTSTSPRIREIMTMDGGLERLVRILHDFCMCPPPPENPAILYGLTPPNARIPKLTPALNPHTFDKHAAYRFSLAFQCIVNIGVRGSEPIRSRVVQAGTLDVVGCILEAWLANKGFAVGPSSSATGIPRETKEQRQQRRIAQSEQKQREEAAQLQKALQRQLQVDQANHRTTVKNTRRPEAGESMDYSPASTSTSHILLLSESQPSTSNSDTDVSADNSVAATPQGSGTPTGSVVIPSRDRSGTIIARPVWDHQANNNVTPPPTAAPPRGRRIRHRELPPESPSASTDVSRAETETEDDGDQDIDMDRGAASRIDSDVASVSASPSPERRPRTIPRHNLPRRAVGIVSDEPTPGPQTLQVGGLGIGADAHIIINDAGGVGDGGVEVGVEDGIVSLETNDDFAMGAPPGAPGAIGDTTTPRMLNLDGGRRRNTVDAPDATPRATAIGLPVMPGASTNGTTRTNYPPQHQASTGHHRTATIRGRPTPTDNGPTGTTVGAAAAAAAAAASLNNTLGGRTSSIHHHRDSDSGPYRDEDVLLSLQLLAYLSKYPHVRQAFYKPRVTFHPASVNLPGARFGAGIPTGNMATREKLKEKASASTSTFAPSSSMASASSSSSTKEGGFFKALTNAATGNSRGKDRAQPIASSSTPMIVAQASGAPSSARQTNVFSLVERFTFKPSSTETDLPNPPPRLPPEIQYWAGVIMRNACRKDDSRGGIRQCANMMCGKWESYPREFAKCRRCRKAKYCGKECQSTAWSEGHRFWCSAKEADDDNLGDQSQSQANSTTSNSNTNRPNQPADMSASGIHISVPSGNMETSVPVTSDNSPARTDRRQQPHQQQQRDRGQEGGRGNEDDPTVVLLRGHSRAAAWASPQGPQGAGAAGPSTIPMPAPTTYVNPTTTAPRAESSMSRDRTVQPRNISTLYTFRPSTNPQIPEGATYLGYPVQSPFPDPGGGFRRRAETITGAIRTTSNDVFGAVSHTRPAYMGSASDWSTIGPAASASAARSSSNAVVLPTSSSSSSPSREAGSSSSSSQRSRVVAMHNHPASPPTRGDDMVLG